jgi:hypothetical protein
MKKITKAKLLSYLLVNSLTTRTITKTNKEIAKDLGCQAQEVEWWISVMKIANEIKVWDEDGVRHVSVFC